MEMKIKSNYHTHTFLCKHAVGDVDDYVKRAISLGYDTIAITDHGPFTEKLRKKIHSRRMSLAQYNEVYLDHLERAKKDHSDKIKILTGVEIEYLEDLEILYKQFISELDLLILGQHYLKKEDGTFLSIYEMEFTEENVDLYCNSVINAMETGYFKIFAHPDIFLWNIREWNELCEKTTRRLVSAAIKNNIVLEINVNGVRNAFYQEKTFYTNGKLNFPYPRREFWNIAKEMKATIIINDDAHAPNRIQDEFTIAVYKEVNRLGIKYIEDLDVLNKTNE